MQQSNVIFANLLIAFLLFISARGELPIYITLLRGGGDQPSSGSASGGSQEKEIAGVELPTKTPDILNNDGSFEDAVKKMLQGKGSQMTPDQARQILDLWEG